MESTRTTTSLMPTLRPPIAPPVRGFLDPGHKNRPLAPLAEPIRGRPAYGNGEKTFFVYIGKEAKTDGEKGAEERMELRLIQEVRPEESPYRIFCKLVLEPGTIRIEDIQNIYPGSEPDLISMHEPPFPEWKGLGFFPVILEHVKAIAAEKGIHRVTIDPQIPDLRLYYAEFGFEQAPERESRMQLTL